MAKKSRIIEYVLLLAICLASTNSYAGKLDEARETTNDSSSSNDDGDYHSHSMGDGDSSGWKLALAIFFSPFSIPRSLAEENGPSTSYFAGGPYQKNLRGNMHIENGKNWYEANPSD